MAAEQTLCLLPSGSFSFAVCQTRCLGIYYHSGIPAANRHVVETRFFSHWRDMYLLWRASFAAHETALQYRVQIMVGSKKDISLPLTVNECRSVPQGLGWYLDLVTWKSSDANYNGSPQQHFRLRFKRKKSDLLQGANHSDPVKMLPVINQYFCIMYDLQHERGILKVTAVKIRHLNYLQSLHVYVKKKQTKKSNTNIFLKLIIF